MTLVTLSALQVTTAEPQIGLSTEIMSERRARCFVGQAQTRLQPQGLEKHSASVKCGADIFISAQPGLSPLGRGAATRYG